MHPPAWPTGPLPARSLSLALVGSRAFPMETFALWFVIAVALAFDFTNGFHDAANSIATVVATRVLSPRYAVVWAAAFNFIAFLVFKTHVASTIAKGVVSPETLSIAVVFAGLIGAISWNLITFFLGLPTSA